MPRPQHASVTFVTDEFLIRATGHAETPDREWTRSTLVVAKFVARVAMELLNYPKVEVFNTFGGDMSSALWVVTPEKSYDPEES